MLLIYDSGSKMDENRTGYYVILQGFVNLKSLSNSILSFNTAPSNVSTIVLTLL